MDPMLVRDALALYGIAALVVTVQFAYWWWRDRRKGR